MIKCPLCSFKFDPEKNIACASCPFKKSCKVICCPNCGYQTVEEGKMGDAFKKILKELKGRKNGIED